MQGKEGKRSRLALVTGGRAADAARAAPPQAAGGETALAPFAAAADRYFETAALRDCHARVARAALEGDTVTVIEGERGCGKTTFVRMLQQRVGNSRDLCFIAVRMAQGERYVLDCLARAFCPEPSPGADALIAQLVERGRRRGPCLVVVDDADRLSVFALRRLFTLKQEVEQAGGRLGIVITLSPARVDGLFGLPSFAAWRKGGLTRVELPRFSAQETADYLHARIQSAGLGAAISFAPAQVRRIHQASGGLPQHIKRAAGELLDGIRPRSYRGGRRRSRDLKHTLIPVALVVVPVICIGLLLHAILQRPGAEVMDRLMSTEGIEAAGTAVPLASAPPVSGAVDRAPDDAEPSAPARAARAMSPRDGEPPAAAAPAAPAVAPTVGPTIAPQQKVPPAAAPAPVVATAAPEPVASEPAHGASPSIQAEPSAPASVSAPVTAPAIETAAPAARAPADTARLDGNEWLRAQNPADYTLQLAGAAERKDVQEFIDKYGLPGKVVIVEILRSGKVWYMVLYNSYATWGEARRELGTLPAVVRRNDPFARRFASVQALAVPAP